MSKPFPYWLRLSIVSSLSVLLSFNPAFAGRVIHRAVCGNGIRVPSVTTVDGDCCTPVMPVAPSCGCDVVASMPVDSGCGCGGSTVISSAPAMEAISVPACGCGSSMADSTMVPSVIEHVPSTESMVPSIAPDATMSPSNSAPVVPSVTPNQSIESIDAAPPTPKKELAEPKTEPVVEPKKELENTAPKPPADDLFSTPSTPPAQPKDELFSTPAANEPPPKPAAPAEDLFSPTPEPTKPAAPADDLFSTPPAMKSETPSPAVDDLFGAPPAANTPAPSNAGDDLFGTPPSPAGSTDVDNLFKSTQATPSFENDFESAKPVSTEVESDPNFDELFANPGAKSKVESPKTKSSDSRSKPALESPKTPNEAGFDSLFKSTSAKNAEPSADAGPAFRGAEFREWVDNTGDYSVKARLVVIYPDRVRLVKENGKFTTVPMSRLCNTDRDYVNWVAVSLSTGAAAKFVNTEINPANNLQELAR